MNRQASELAYGVINMLTVMDLVAWIEAEMEFALSKR